MPGSGTCSGRADTGFRSAAYRGTVVHKRLVPRQHGFSYRVFSLALDVDEIDLLSRSLRLFSRNTFNLLSFHDRDHGAGDAPVGDHVRKLLCDADLADAGARVVLLCYPRLFGYVFNPLSVYFCFDASDCLRVLVYEVNNTFGERRSYIVPVGAGAGPVVAQACDKGMYVSPFTGDEGRYSFHIRAPGEDVLVGVALRTNLGPTLKTHFRGARMPLSDRKLLGLVIQNPLMTFKIVGAIHFEALRLWVKGLAFIRRPKAPRFSITVVSTPADAIGQDGSGSENEK